MHVTYKSFFKYHAGKIDITLPQKFTLDSPYALFVYFQAIQKTDYDRFFQNNQKIFSNRYLTADECIKWVSSHGE
jgi:hypothetical protein